VANIPEQPVNPPDHLPTAPLAYENEQFLNSHDGRIVRILAEYTEPLARFRRERIQDTIVFFGSARFRPLADAVAGLELLENTSSRHAAPHDEQPAAPGDVTVSRLKQSRATAAVQMARYYEDARKLSAMLSTWAASLEGPRHRFVITSGGGPGIMEAANRGAHEAGCKTIGLNIALPFEQEPNRYITPELNFQFHYFFMRKFWFAYLAKALVVFPGGFGTLDEAFELLTLAQTQKLAKKIPVVIYGSQYWNEAINFQSFVDRGTIAPRDLDLFQFADTPEQAFAILQESLKDHIATRAARSLVQVEAPAPSAEDLLGPDIAKTRP
jgi:hypothetical protein